MQDKSISIMIPAFNEENRIGGTIKSVLNLPGVVQVIVVDDGSQDNTSAESLRCGAEVVTLKENKGKGNALNAGADRIKGDILLLLDADLGTSASLVEGLVEPIRKKQADMTLAIFPKTAQKAGFGLVRGLARKGIHYFTGFESQAPLSGQRAMLRKVFEDLMPLADGFGVEVDLTIRALLKGYRIAEVPLELSHRFTGRNVKDFIHRGKQLYDVMRVLRSIKRPGCRNA